MIINTAAGTPVGAELIRNYFKSLVNQFFKILPIRENEGHTLPVYLRSLQIELLGNKEFVPDFGTNASYLALLSILQYMIDNPDCETAEVRREVFRAISICNKLKAIYAENEVQ